MKGNCQVVNSSQKCMNEFVFTSMRRVFIRSLEEIEDSKKAIRNYLTFRSLPRDHFKGLSFYALCEMSCYIWQNLFANSFDPNIFYICCCKLSSISKLDTTLVNQFLPHQKVCSFRVKALNFPFSRSEWVKSAHWSTVVKFDQKRVT